ncbi:conserved hypothetical protein [Histoplasma capsulatum G186AR]|uniref:Uncharacterized protein n=2 Tax=Ajellomyces capsulatus TaxID=5037 RepID=C0NTB5_AJECG|nr:uncharacterized protein HCBG_06395 [Histoplasma capsulatum G186AR]EEH05276.1 conserved hypothetical protein [Histoplasma capsulatum G186AR]KAG5305352.1 hypothetical protein I7I52_03980 [Histoplasma capsulatum]QSS76313.1 hypothetical protein I7I50_05720 [Histoplasma capsulatum G186AR]
MSGLPIGSSAVPTKVLLDASKSTTSSKQASRERALEIKRLQEEALRGLPVDSLYVVLYLRSDPPAPNDFHWGYYFHTHPDGGIKYHLKSLGSGWITEHGPTGGVFKSNFLCVLVHIATVPQEKHLQVDQIMKSLDGRCNSIPGITCRVWIMNILQKLIENGIVQCPSIAEFQQECFTIGNQNSKNASANNQPRPVIISRVCII